MKPWQFALVGLALLATAGCRSDPAIPILERELRLQEDEIYRLRATWTNSKIAARRVRDADRRQHATPAEPEAAAPRHRRGSRRTERRAAAGRRVPSQPATEMPDTLKTPPGRCPPASPRCPKTCRARPSRSVPGTGPSSRSETATDDRSPGPANPTVRRWNGAWGEVTSRSGRVTLASSRRPPCPSRPRATAGRWPRIALNRTLTGGISAGDGAGDQGLLVVVEPRDRAGRTVDAPADMSVVVLDPALEGDAARVARWDFTAAETAAMFRRSGSSRAIHLTTAWPGDPPAHHKLHLFVRYVTADGRKLQADQPIEVALPGDKTARWTPSDSPARRPDGRGASGGV